MCVCATVCTIQPFAAALDALSVPWSDWDMSAQSSVDLSRAPPPGVFYNRMSASSHTRDHRYSAELTSCVLAWLHRHSRTVVNCSGALDLEVNKCRQYSQLEAAGLRVPCTVLVPIQHACTHRDSLVAAAERHFPKQPFILKPNRGGKGFGVRLFSRPSQLRAYLDSDDAAAEAPIDGQWLLQQYIRAQPSVITRMEFVGGRFLYAVEVDTSSGFLLCPADECQTAVGDAACPAPAAPAPAAASKFTVLEQPSTAHAALIPNLERMLAANGVHVAGVEVVRDEAGELYPYDVNTNTSVRTAHNVTRRRPHRAVARHRLGRRRLAKELKASRRPTQPMLDDRASWTERSFAQTAAAHTSSARGHLERRCSAKQPRLRNLVICCVSHTSRRSTRHSPSLLSLCCRVVQ